VADGSAGRDRLRRLLSRLGRPAQLLDVLQERSSLDFQILGRTLLHAAAVGLAAGIVGGGFFAALEWVNRLLLEDLAGYEALKAHGETFLRPEHGVSHFRPWLFVILPALGGLICGLLTRLAPETAGGGGDAMIDAFHEKGGDVRARVGPVKFLASIATLGTGGSGGREGPTMQIGAAIGSIVGRWLRVPKRERRVLMVAGVAAGMSAVFRTPLGAALLAVEVLYRDDFEAEALIPAVLASVVSYSVVISFYGESILFQIPHRFPFTPGHLVLFGLLGVAVALLAAAFDSTLHRVQRFSKKLPGPVWLRPAIGGLALGLLFTPFLTSAGSLLGFPRASLGILGGGYGMVQQLVLQPAAFVPAGWAAVRLLLLLTVAKLFAASLTIGTGGSAGDFAPSLVLGGLFGGAFGLTMRLMIGDPSIDPAAFALVGMGAFYGGIAHVPLSALVFVSELSGSYDLLVPLMLAEGIAFVALRNRSLYSAQPRLRRDSPAHRASLILDALEGVVVSKLLVAGRPFISFERSTPASVLLRAASESTGQEVFPVLDGGRMIGIITPDTLRMIAAEPEVRPMTIAADVMRPPVHLDPDDDLREAMHAMLAQHLRELPVADAEGRVIGFLDEADITQAYLVATEKAPPAG
jgi:CIC family chloride channel protein